MGVVTFILTALFFLVAGMIIMSIMSSKEIEDAYADGYNRVYRVAKEEKKIKWAENERAEERTLQ